MSHNGTGPHVWYKGPVRKGKRVKDRMETMDLLGRMVVVTVDVRLVYVLDKRPPSFLSSSFENKLYGTCRRCRTVSGCAVEKYKDPPVLHVWPCAKSHGIKKSRNSLGGKRMGVEKQTK